MSAPSTAARSARSPARSSRLGPILVVCGLGNIGSHVVSNLARMRDVARLMLIDGDTYDQHNIWGQAIMAGDIGRPKVDVQARRIRRINPELDVQAVRAWLEEVPRGHLRADALISCLDSRAARQRLNEIAWRLGTPLIDAAVDAGGLMARVNVFMPGANSPCCECAWNSSDYEALEQSYACQDGRAQVAATAAPAHLGAIAGALIATECGKLLESDWDHVAVNRQLLLDLRHHTSLLTHLTVNPACRFDHEVYSIGALAASPGRITLRGLCRWAVRHDCGRIVSIHLPDHRFVRRLVCPHCEHTSRECLFLHGRLPERKRVCQCGRRMQALAFHSMDRLLLDSLGSRDMSRSLASIGFRQGDILTVIGEASTRHVELGASPQAFHSEVSS